MTAPCRFPCYAVGIMQTVKLSQYAGIKYLRLWDTKTVCKHNLLPGKTDRNRLRGKGLSGLTRCVHDLISVSSLITQFLLPSSLALSFFQDLFRVATRARHIFHFSPSCDLSRLTSEKKLKDVWNKGRGSLTAVALALNESAWSHPPRAKVRWWGSAVENLSDLEKNGQRRSLSKF